MANVSRLPRSAGRLPPPNSRTPLDAPAGDAVLLRLGEQFEAAWAAERLAWDAADNEQDDGPLSIEADRLSDVTSAFVTLIENTPATTFAGIRLKGRALRWCRSDDLPGPEVFGSEFVLGDVRARLSTDQRVVVSLLADLHAMTGDGA